MRPRKSDLHLPPRVYLRHGAYFYVERDGTWVRIGSNIEQVDQAMKMLQGGSLTFPTKHLSTIYCNAKKNARPRGIAFELTMDDVRAMWTRSRGRCELTGLRFDLMRVQGCHRRPMAPSIDRVDSSAGYTPPNCRLVSVAINLAMNEWGEAVFERIARGFLRRKS